MKVLIACEYSGRVRDAFASKGHEVLSCDFEPTETPGNHYQGDIIDVLGDGWDLMVAHPPCTYLTNSGVCWLHRDPARWEKLDEGAAFFKLLMDAPIEKKCLENPIMHKYAKQRIGNQKQSQTIQPWMFGHTQQKATCLWLTGLPLLQPTNDVKREMLALPDKERQKCHYMSPGPNRWKERSRTFLGIANAMAAQWG